LFFTTYFVRAKFKFKFVAGVYDLDGYWRQVVEYSVQMSHRAIVHVLENFHQATWTRDFLDQQGVGHVITLFCLAAAHNTLQRGDTRRIGHTHRRKDMHAGVYMRPESRSEELLCIVLHLCSMPIRNWAR
jgi:hypothetical protein